MPRSVPVRDVERPLRLLHVVRPAVGGMKEHVLDVCRGLSERGHSVELACPRGSEVAQDARDLGLPVHEIELVGPLRPVADARGIRQLAMVVRSGEFDVVHAHGFKAGLVARPAAVMGRCAVRIVTVHNHVMYRDDISTFTKWRYRAAERGLSHVTTRIIAVSDSLRDELIDAYGIDPDLVVTVHNGVDTHAFLDLGSGSKAKAAYGLAPGTPVVGTAARFAPQKDLGRFVDAAAQVLESHPEARFLLGGDGPLKGELEARIRELDLGERLQLIGFVEDMPGFLSALDVYVSSSLSEGLPLTLVQVGAASTAHRGDRRRRHERVRARWRQRRPRTAGRLLGARPRDRTLAR